VSIVIKYLGSKRRLVRVLGNVVEASGARTVLDLFTGTTRVAQELKRRGLYVTAVDSARYSEVFGQCYVAADRRHVDAAALHDAIARLNRTPGRPGYVTETFCVRSRFFQRHNGERIDAIRDTIEADHAGDALYPILLTSLLEAADRVDSTTGVQMAYVKRWSARSYQPLELRVPELLAGRGVARRGDAVELVRSLGAFDVAYLDPPYNQHRYDGNYHIWETLVAWDAPEPYGVACKRSDLRDPRTRSVFNSRRAMPSALASVVADVDARVLVLSYNDEAWIELDELREMCSVRGHVEALAFESKRYVGAQIGIHNPNGEKVGTVGRLRNLEYVLLAGEPAVVRRMAAAGRASEGTAGPHSPLTRSG
jgi:adenine-specific DNA-methyltransferase